GEITGRVVAEGGPVGDAFINFSRVSESEAANASSQRRSVRWGNWGKTPILTDADGRFTVTGLTPGNYLLQATREGGGEGFAEDVAVGSDVTIEIASAASLSGRVTSAAELPADLELTLRDKTSGVHLQQSSFES